MKKYFGTDGVRGCVGGSLINANFMKKLGYAVGLMLRAQFQKNPRVLIGRDTRASGELLQNALQAGLLLADVDVILLGVMTTPAVAFLTQKLQTAAGIVISASHNPHEDNGIKIIGHDGFKLSDEWELAVEEKIDSTPSFSEKNKIATVTTLSDSVSQYISHCVNTFKNTVSLQNKKIILDCANGAAFNCASDIFSQLGANVIAIHNNPDGKNINDHCGATSVASLQSVVLAEKADCGIAFDGDGDRLMMVDHLGERVDGDEILCMLALDPAKKYTAVVGTLMSNLGLEKALQSHHIQFERAAVGDRYVLEKIQKNKWRLGGEASGHIVNLDYATTGDGIITALQVLRIMQQEKQSLYALKKIMQKRPQILINIPVKNPNRFSTIPDINNAVLRAEKILNHNGRILLRASGTESCVRVMVECDCEQTAREIVKSVAAVVKKSLE